MTNPLLRSFLRSSDAHAISNLRSGKVLVDPHKDHKRHKDPLEEKDDQSSIAILLKEDSNDEEAPDEELTRAEHNPEVYKPLVPYPRFLSQSRVSTSENNDSLRPLDRLLSPSY